jgi:hypothetical protein
MRRAKKKVVMRWAWGASNEDNGQARGDGDD